MKIGDLVKYVSGSQLYFHFPSERWQNALSGTVGVIVEAETGYNGEMYLVLGANNKCYYWFYEDELEIISEAKRNG